MRSVSKLVGGAFLLSCLGACGGSEPTPKTVDTAETEEEDRRDGPIPSVSGEVGALDQGKVDKAFETSVKELSRCLESGAKRVEFLGGAVAFYVKIDQRGSMVHAHLEQTSVGDRETEKCMLEVLAKRDWPAPVGGEMGFARKSFDFDPPNDVRPPTEWSPDRVQDTLSKSSSDIKKCKGDASGTYNVTMYVDTKGHALAVGIAPPDEKGESAVDCLVDVLKGASYPSPGSWPAKVAFTL
jgi:hypothetical protein